MLLRMVNRLGPFSGASDRCEGQEQVGVAVGDQGEPSWVVDIQDLVICTIHCHETAVKTRQQNLGRVPHPTLFESSSLVVASFSNLSL